MDDKGQLTRPTFGAEGAEAQEAREAVERLVKELQTGRDQHNADISNRHFASDIMWGSPFGATVHGYEELHSMHVRLKKRRTGGPSSRFEIVRVLVPVPGAAVAQVRRTALDSQGNPLESSDDLTRPFSEMALYVLVRRDRVWWLAAGQNTPIRSAATAKS